MFNVIGVIWVLAVFYPFVNMVCGFVDYNPAVGAVNANIKVKLPVVLAAFHTTFNVANTFLTDLGYSSTREIGLLYYQTT